MSRNHYVSGEWNLICDCCGKKVKANQAKKRWDGFIVCPDDWEERHPQDFVRARQDKITVPYTRPRPPDIFGDTGNRDVSDLITVYELLSLQTLPSFTDEIGFDDVGQDYIDPSYFAEEYIEGSGLMIQVLKVLSDTATIVESGSIYTNDYIDGSYFAEDYVGTTTIF